MADAAAQDPPLPSRLPVLPLRSTVVFPLTVQPLAVNRAVSVDAVNRALAGDRMLVLVMQVGDSDDPEPSQLRKVGTVAVIRQMAKGAMGLQILVEGVARVRLDDVTRDGNVMDASITAAPEPDATGLEIDAYLRTLRDLVEKAFSLATGLSPDLRSIVSGIDEPLRLVYLLATLIDMKPEDKQLLLEQDDLRVKLSAITAGAEARSRTARTEGQDRVAGAAGDERRAAPVLPAAAAQGHPVGTRRRGRPGNHGAAQAARGRQAARSRPEAGHARGRSPRAHVTGLARVPDAAHVPRLGARGAVERDDARSSRSARRARRARRGSLRPRQDQGPHRRVPRGAQAEERHEGPDPVLRRPSGRRQDLARAVDRARHEPQVRAHLARRRARRGGDPRPSPHVHRLDARPPRPGAQAGRVDEPRVHARRNRQAAGGRLLGRPGVGDARGARSGAEPHVPRSLPGSPGRPVEGAVHRDREQPRHRAPGAARSHGDHQPERVHRGGQGAHRAEVPDPAADEGARPAGRRPRSHRRGARAASCASTRGRRACAVSSDRSAPSPANSPRVSPASIPPCATARQTRRPVATVDMPIPGQPGEGPHMPPPPGGDPEHVPDRRSRSARDARRAAPGRGRRKAIRRRPTIRIATTPRRRSATRCRSPTCPS